MKLFFTVLSSIYDFPGNSMLQHTAELRSLALAPQWPQKTADASWITSEKHVARLRNKSIDATREMTKFFGLPPSQNYSSSESDSSTTTPW